MNRYEISEKLFTKNFQGSPEPEFREISQFRFFATFTKFNEKLFRFAAAVEPDERHGEDEQVERSSEKNILRNKK